MQAVVHEVEDKSVLEAIKSDAIKVANELLAASKLTKGQIVVIGCSTSETLGEKIGCYSVPEAGKAIYDGLKSVFDKEGIYMAAQCCEHLNRAIIVERDAVPFSDIVNVIPQPKAGGSFATAAYADMNNPVAVEEIKADAGIDIGGTLIGMHLKKVAVPVKLSHAFVGKAHVTAARVRPKFIGGERAGYDENLK